MLSLIIFIPILAALAILVGAPARKTAFGAAIAQFALTLFAFLSYNKATGGFQFASISPIVPEWKLNYAVGADGLSLVMLLLTGIVTLAAIWVTPKIEKRENLFYACVLFISAGAAGAFASTDLFFFYAFHELALIPTFLLIGMWGTGERYTAAWKITIYLGVGSFVLLIGLLDLYLAVPEASRTFNLIELAAASRKTGSFPPPRKAVRTFSCSSVLAFSSRSSRSIPGRRRPMPPRLHPWPCCTPGC